jgi:predicted RNA-binding Zn-ribbon protein involved in translation (DUF1610 family)
MIEFTQYLRPHGEKRQVWIEIPSVQEKADLLIKAGYHFDIEELSTGMISMTCEDNIYHSLVSIRVCPNGPEVVDNVIDLIEESYESVTFLCPSCQKDGLCKVVKITEKFTTWECINCGHQFKRKLDWEDE